jgi:F-type H+-transporting ATPase subunit epsilon
MRVLVVSPDEARFDGEATSVVAPAYDGQVGILPRHAPFVTLLGEGELSIRQGSEITKLRVSGGFLQVSGDTVRIVTDRVMSIS